MLKKSNKSTLDSLIILEAYPKLLINDGKDVFAQCLIRFTKPNGRCETGFIFGQNKKKESIYWASNAIPWNNGFVADPESSIYKSLKDSYFKDIVLLENYIR